MASLLGRSSKHAHILHKKTFSNVGILKRFSSDTQFDLVVIGSGPGGYVAAIKASQLGLKTACVEKDSTLGGTCLNVGCIPSKALLHASHIYHEIKSKKFENLGIKCDNIDLDWDGMLAHKKNTVKSLTGGISALFKANKVTHINGMGTLINPGTSVSIKTSINGQSEIISSKNVLIATGSESTAFPGIQVDEEVIVSSTGALSLKRIPEKLIVIGAGVIGLEIGSVYARLGSKVTIVEYLDNVGGSAIDNEVSKSIQKFSKKIGIDFLLSHQVLSAQRSGGQVTVNIKPKGEGEIKQLTSDVLLVSVGRRPYTSHLGLSDVGINLDNKGAIIVDDSFMTSCKNVYAIGDCIPGPMLAHKAEDEGVACVEGIAGNKHHINYNAIPSVIYTHPEVAWVGVSEEIAKQKGIKYKVGKFPLIANGRSKCVSETDGFVKIITDAATDVIIGGHIIAPCGGELINQLALAIEYGASAEDVARVCHAHPTVAEAIKEASLAAYFGKPINSI